MVIPLEEVGLSDSLSYEKAPIKIFDWQVRRFWTKDVDSVNILWRNQKVEEANLEAKEYMKSNYKFSFSVLKIVHEVCIFLKIFVFYLC